MVNVVHFLLPFICLRLQVIPSAEILPAPNDLHILIQTRDELKAKYLVALQQS
jgi:hypothetical protein